MPPMSGSYDRARVTCRLAAGVALALVVTALSPSESAAHPPRGAQPSGHEKSEGVTLTSDQRRESVRSGGEPGGGPRADIRSRCYQRRDNAESFSRSRS